MRVSKSRLYHLDNELNYEKQVTEEEQKLREIRDMKISLENLETYTWFAQLKSQRNTNIENDSWEITLFLAFSTDGKDN